MRRQKVGWWLSGALMGILLLVVCASIVSQTPKPVAVSPNPGVPGNFKDVTDSVGVHFLDQAPHTSRKYLLETMGSGVALFDCDNDGRLDMYMVI